MVRLLNDDTTVFALQHRFRPIKKEAAAMLAGTCTNPPPIYFRPLCFLSQDSIPNLQNFLSSNLLLSSPHTHTHYAFRESLANFFIAIAREYGDGVTGKAVSTYFERARKDPNWDRSRSAADIKSEGTPVKTPASRKRGQSKNSKKTATTDEDDTEVQFDETPTKKKTPLNKTAGGRVTKPSSGRAKPRLNYAEPDDEDDELNDEVTIIKSENASNPFISNGHSNGNGNSNGHSHSNGHDDNGFGNDYEENGYNASSAETFYAAAGEEYV